MRWGKKFEKTRQTNFVFTLITIFRKVDDDCNIGFENTTISLVLKRVIFEQYLLYVKCDQIGRFSKKIGDKFCYKSSPNICNFLSYFERVSGHLLGKFLDILGYFIFHLVTLHVNLPITTCYCLWRKFLYLFTYAMLNLNNSYWLLKITWQFLTNHSASILV